MSSGRASENSMLKATPTYADIYGTGHALATRACDGVIRWLPQDRRRLEAIAGNQISVLGGMGIVCNAGCVAPDVLALLQAAGIFAAADIVSYRIDEDYFSVIAGAAERFHHLVTNFTSPAGLIPDETLWIPPGLLAWLNNKRNLDTLAPAGGFPRRVVVPHGGLRKGVAEFSGGPVIVKVATDLGSGGGTDVVRCLAPADIERADTEFADAEELVIEEFVEMETSYCLNYGVTADGGVIFLGGAEQICDDDDIYLGNIIDHDRPPPADAVALGAAIARAAAAHGFYGVCGFDVAIRRDGPPLVFDLNFRSNGCTAQLLIDPGLRESRGHRVSRLFYTRYPGTLAQAGLILDEGIQAGWLVPLSGFDPLAGGFTDGPARLQLLVLGDSLQEANARVEMLRAAGFA